MKGFTLIEVMGVIIIIGILAAITVPVVTNVLKENQEKLYEVQKSNIEGSAKNFVSENLFSLDLDEGNRFAITIGKLKELGYLEESVIKSETKKDFTDDTAIIVENKNGDITYTVCIDVECNLDNITYYGE